MYPQYNYVLGPGWFGNMFVRSHGTNRIDCVDSGKIFCWNVSGSQREYLQCNNVAHICNLHGVQKHNLYQLEPHKAVAEDSNIGDL